MDDIVKSQLAKNDLKEIWHYSRHEWGESKATEYLLQLDAGIGELIANPELGKSRDTIRNGYRSIQINRHVIYYRLDDQKIVIIRVLHERMMPSKHM